MRSWLAKLFKPVLTTALDIALTGALVKAKKKVSRSSKLDDEQKEMVNAILDETAENIKSEVDGNL